MLISTAGTPDVLTSVWPALCFRAPVSLDLDCILGAGVGVTTGGDCDIWEVVLGRVVPGIILTFLPVPLETSPVLLLVWWYNCSCLLPSCKSELLSFLKLLVDDFEESEGLSASCGHLFFTLDRRPTLCSQLSFSVRGSPVLLSSASCGHLFFTRECWPWLRRQTSLSSITSREKWCFLKHLATNTTEITNLHAQKWWMLNLCVFLDNGIFCSREVLKVLSFVH